MFTGIAIPTVVAAPKNVIRKAFNTAVHFILVPVLFSIVYVGVFK